MRRLRLGLVLLALAACDPTVDNGILGIGVSGDGGGGGGTGGAATKLVFTSQPQPTQATAAMATAVTVQAEYGVGQVDTTYSGVITLSLSPNPDTAAIGGNFSVSAINGVATFSNLTVDKADTGYALLATASGLTSTVSVKFTVTP